MSVKSPVALDHAIVTARPERVHIAFLDGMRGLAALYVVFFHIAQATEQQAAGPISSALWWAFAPISAGRAAVSVFIVLSGFLLMMPVVKRDGPIGRTAYLEELKTFFKRRARRILPPYYAALGLATLMCLLVKIDPTAHLFLASSYPLTRGALLAHLLLLHNWLHLAVYRIDGPLWSVATEFQIYFVFALVLVPIWRRWGIGAAICLAFSLTLPLAFKHKADRAGAWLLGIFSIGMLTAQIAFSPRMTCLRETRPGVSSAQSAGRSSPASSCWPPPTR